MDPCMHSVIHKHCSGQFPFNLNFPKTFICGKVMQFRICPPGVRVGLVMRDFGPPPLHLHLRGKLVSSLHMV